MKDFTEIDAKIMTRILGGFNRFYEIWPVIGNGTFPNPDRVVDRRLQALRKQGKIVCQGQRWYIAPIDSRSAK